MVEMLWGKDEVRRPEAEGTRIKDLTMFVL